MRVPVPSTSIFATTLTLAALLLAIPQSATAQGIPGVEPNKCLAGKNQCVSKKIAGLMKCRELCQKVSDKKCGAVQTACEQKVMAKFDGGAAPEKGCFEKLEGKANPAKPDSVCTTTDDTAAVESEVDAAVAEFIARLEGAPPSPPTCPTECLNAILQWSEHNFSNHTESVSCSYNSGQAQVIANHFYLDFPFHSDALHIGSTTCTTLISSMVVQSLEATVAEINVCAAAAARIVELITGEPCDVSAP